MVVLLCFRNIKKSLDIYIIIVEIILWSNLGRKNVDLNLRLLFPDLNMVALNYSQI